MLKILTPVLTIIALAACSSGPIVAPPNVAAGSSDKAEVLLYRQTSSVTFETVLLFGLDRRNLAELRENEYVLIEIPPGRYEFFVRIPVGANPAGTLSASLAKGERKCLRSYASASRVVPLLGFFTGAFQLEEFPCPGTREIQTMVKVSTLPR